MSKTYSLPLVLQLLDSIEFLALSNESLARQLDKVDSVFVGTQYNWQGSDKGRIDMLKQLLATVEAHHE